MPDLESRAFFEFSIYEAYYFSSNALHDALQNTLSRMIIVQHNFNYINPGRAYR